MKRIIVFIGFLSTIYSAISNTRTLFKFEINQEINPAAWRITKKAIEQAHQIKADYILLRLNTYGGLVDAADSIRTKILNSQIPVLVFIDNNAASAGALIAIAGDSIYMREGSSMGAATVVDQQGKVVPDKYQSYMRAIMRATAQAHGKKPKIKDNDTIWVWHRDPDIAQAMVDPSIYIEGVIDTGKVLTLTADEAIKLGYCEGKAENIVELINKAGINEYQIKEYKVTTLDRILGFFMHPAVQGILIMIIVAGIYFELQSPGIGFPLIAAIIAALLYFSPLYLEGIAENWEIIVFVVGLILLAVEIFVLPGFGIAGIAGLLLMLIGLTLAMVDKIPNEPVNIDNLYPILRAFALVIVSITISMVLSIYFGSKLARSRALPIALHTEQNKDNGYIGVEIDMLTSLVGKTGKSVTVLRPSGKVEIEGNFYDAISEWGFIEPDTPIKVIKTEASQIYVSKL